MRRRWRAMTAAVILAMLAPALASGQSAIQWVFHAGATAPADGTEMPAEYFSTIGVQVEGTFVGTVQFQKKTKDATTWAAVQCTNVTDRSADTEATGPGYWECPGGAYRFKAPVTAYSSGTIVVTGTGTTAVSSRGSGGGGLSLPGTIVHADEGTPVKFYGTGVQTNNGWQFGQGSDGVPFMSAIVGGVVDGVDYYRKCGAGFECGFKDSAGTKRLTVAGTGGALTNVTFNAEATGNNITLKRHKWFPAAACVGTTPSTIWDLPATNPAVAVCRSPTNTTKGVLEFADGVNALTAQITEFLNEDWVGAIEATIVWQSGSTLTDTVVWMLALACAGEGESDNPAFTDDAFTADANKATANQYNLTAVNTITTTGTCAANKLMHVRVKRDPGHASDTLVATAQLVGVALKLREAQ